MTEQERVMELEQALVEATGQEYQWRAYTASLAALVHQYPDMGAKLGTAIAEGGQKFVEARRRTRCLQSELDYG